MDKTTLLHRLENRLIVSCQPAAPLNVPAIIAGLAEAAINGGAAGIRVNGAADIAAVRARVQVPIIGINKQRTEGFTIYITPTLASAQAAIDAGADIIALDGSPDPRPTGITLEALIDAIKAQGRLVMADISTLEDGLAASAAGADIVASTLSGYTSYSLKIEGPDLDLVEALARQLNVPIIAEGRYHSPDHVRAAFDRGAFAVVVGTAITEIAAVTRKFAAAASGSGS
jgi:N-acylglucosamine-6-phosphate 2-epimerase